MSVIDEAPFRSTMRWYPRSWRKANEDVLVGTLLDAADAEGRTAPTATERRDLAVNGIRARLAIVVPGAVRDRIAALSLGAGAGLAMVFVFGQLWAPTVPGSFNPGEAPPDHLIVQVLPLYVLWLLATGAALLGRPWIARGLVLLTIPAAIWSMTAPESDFLFRPSRISVLLLVSLAILAFVGRPTRDRATRRVLLIATGGVGLIALLWVMLYRPFGPGSLVFPRGGMLELFASGLVGVLLVVLFIAALGAGRRDLASASLLAGLPWFVVPVVANPVFPWAYPRLVLSPLGTVLAVVLIALVIPTVAFLVARRRPAGGPAVREER